MSSYFLTKADMLRAWSRLALVVHVASHGAGVWKDPHHYAGDDSLAGLRFVSEGPPHVPCPDSCRSGSLAERRPHRRRQNVRWAIAERKVCAAARA